jgi:hypothetical protein
MRIKVVILSVLLSGSALLGCLALLSGPPSSRAQNTVSLPDNRERGAQSQFQTGSNTGPARLNGGSDERFLQLDRNGDGLLSVDEMPEALRAERDKWDTNGDGFIDLAEWNAYLNAVAGIPPRPAGGSVDRATAHGPQARVQEPGPQSGNPAMAPPPPDPAPKSSSRPPFKENAGRKAPTAASAKLPKNIPAWFKEYDGDGDGQVGLYEWLAKKDDIREFEKYDLNGDGFITVEELVRSGQFAANTKTPPTVNGLQAEVGDFFYLEVTGSRRGVVWGAGVYTADSVLAATAVHAGALEAGETGLVKVTILPGQERYEGSVRNGVTSQDFGAFPKSFRIESTK